MKSSLPPYRIGLETEYWIRKTVIASQEAIAVFFCPKTERGLQMKRPGAIWQMGYSKKIADCMDRKRCLARETQDIVYDAQTIYLMRLPQFQN